MSRYENRNSVTGDLVWGAIAGASAILVADQLDRYLAQYEPRKARARTQAARPGGLDAAQVIAKRAADAVGANLPPQQLKPFGTAVHYGVGSAMGALYGALFRRTPMVGSGHGLLYGVLMSVVADESLSSKLGLSGRPSDYPWTAHARGVVLHGTFGVVTDTLLRLFRRG